jgi:solute carrier family 25 (mitochondrial citrate transporter), member 1
MLRLIPSRLVCTFYLSGPPLIHWQISPGLQKSTAVPGQSSLQRIMAIASEMWMAEGARSFYKGITPRVLRVAPGQAIVFAVYERVSALMEKMGPTSVCEEDTYHT